MKPLTKLQNNTRIHKLLAELDPFKQVWIANSEGVIVRAVVIAGYVHLSHCGETLHTNDIWEAIAIINSAE